MFPAETVTLAEGSHDRAGIPLSATWPRLRFAFAGCLQSALTHQGSDTLDKEDPHAPRSDPGSAMPMETRAVLILELLLAGLTAPAPSLTHLLMGFDTTQGPEGLHSPTSVTACFAGQALISAYHMHQQERTLYSAWQNVVVSVSSQGKTLPVHKQSHLLEA